MNTEAPIIETPVETPIPDAPMSKEDKFFGVMTPLDDTPEGEERPEIIVVDDRPEEDQRPPKSPEVKAGEDDPELTGYSANVNKRIAKLTYEKNEERRGREAAERMQTEAVNFARGLKQKNDNFENIINSGEAHLVETIKGRAANAVALAKSNYQKAYEAGDSEAIISAQQDMINAQAEQRESFNYENDYNYRSQQFADQRQAAQYAAQQAAQQPVQQQQPPRQATDKATQWAENNKAWFGTTKDMTALAYGIHETLMRDEGYGPDSDEYFAELDKRMHTRFPEYFDKAENKPPSNAPTVVASAERVSGAKPRRVKLTQTQVALAKKLGLTPEEYAHEQYALDNS
jgi:hypothetical protein